MMKNNDVHFDLQVRPPGSVSQSKGDLSIQRARPLFRHRKEDLKSLSRGWGWRHHGQSQGADCRSGEGLATAAMSTHSQGEPSYLSDRNICAICTMPASAHVSALTFINILQASIQSLQKK